jgi:hypothetical protein
MKQLQQPGKNVIKNAINKAKGAKMTKTAK